MNRGRSHGIADLRDYLEKSRRFGVRVHDVTVPVEVYEELAEELASRRSRFEVAPSKVLFQGVEVKCAEDDRIKELEVLVAMSYSEIREITAGHLLNVFRWSLGEIKRLRGGVKKGWLNWPAEVVRLQEMEVKMEMERDDAMLAAKYLRVVLTNMTQSEQMEEVYKRWPWLEEPSD